MLRCSDILYIRTLYEIRNKPYYKYVTCQLLLVLGLLLPVPQLRPVPQL
jgi:hypothetical protein